MTEMISHEVQPIPIEETIKTLTEYEELLRRQWAEARLNPIAIDSNHELQHPREEYHRRPVNLITGHILRDSAPVPTPIEVPQGVLLDSQTVVSLHELRNMDNACANVDPDIFYPETVNGTEKKKAAAIAKAICVGCAAIDACRDFALYNGEEFGVWGGLSEAERKKVVIVRV